MLQYCLCPDWMWLHWMNHHNHQASLAASLKSSAVPVLTLDCTEKYLQHAMTVAYFAVVYFVVMMLQLLKDMMTGHVIDGKMWVPGNKTKDNLIADYRCKMCCTPEKHKCCLLVSVTQLHVTTRHRTGTCSPGLPCTRCAVVSTCATCS
jgi:hypothetical protein